MIATRTARELNQEPSKVLRQVESGETVIIEKHGQPCAVIIPYSGWGISGEELARRAEGLKPDPKGAAQLSKILQEVDHAGRSSYPDSH